MIIPKNMIGAVIGPSGKVIQEIQRKTSSSLIIEEIDGKEAKLFAKLSATSICNLSFVDVEVQAFIRLSFDVGLVVGHLEMVINKVDYEVREPGVITFLTRK